MVVLLIYTISRLVHQCIELLKSLRDYNLIICGWLQFTISNICIENIYILCTFNICFETFLKSKSPKMGKYMSNRTIHAHNLIQIKRTDREIIFYNSNYNLETKHRSNVMQNRNFRFFFLAVA